jgi:hypothetical protein
MHYTAYIYDVNDLFDELSAGGYHLKFDSYCESDNVDATLQHAVRAY